MLKLLLVFPALIFGSILLGVGALVFLPMLALLPIILAVGACVLALSLTAGIFLFIFRLFGALLIGIGGLMIVGVGAVALFAGGVATLIVGVAVFHLLLPILFVVGLIWLHPSRGAPEASATRAADAPVKGIYRRFLAACTRSSTPFRFPARDFRHPTTGG